MNPTQARIRESLGLLKPSNIAINEVRTSYGEGPEHREAKKTLCKYLQGKGLHFVTEAIFRTGGRADIFVLENIEVIEILSSEKMESIEEKKKLYPEGIKIIPIRLREE